MPFVSLTRLRIRSLRFVPLFAFHTLRANRQVQRAPGFLAGALLADRNPAQCKRSATWPLFILSGHRIPHAAHCQRLPRIKPRECR